MKPTRREIAFRVVGGTTTLLAFLAVVFTATFFLTSYVFQNVGYEPPAFLAQTINSLLGLIFSGLILVNVSAIIRSRHDHRAMGFAPIIEALERIAKGDFDVRLDDELRDNHMVGDLVKSVNDMALELGRLEQMRQEFISNVSHEIQSPLTSIRGFAGALGNDDLSPSDRRHYLAIIETESMRLSRLTDNLLRLASLEAEQVKFEPKPYRLDRQIRGLVLACEPQWAGKSLDLDVSLEELTIRGDEDLLSQVWLNLIHNAIKFTPAGGSIRIAARRQGNVVEFSISDTGIGILDEDQPRVFERFHKADKSRERAREGSGLGLAIAKRIVEMHRGRIGLESKLGAGTTFTVSFAESLAEFPTEPLVESMPSA